MHVNGQANIHAHRIETGGVHLTKDENKPPPITTKPNNKSTQHIDVNNNNNEGNNYNTNHILV